MIIQKSDLLSDFKFDAGIHARTSLYTKLLINASALAVILATPAQSQTIISAEGIDGTGDGISFPETGDQFGTLSGTFDGTIPTQTDTTATAPQYGVLFGGTNQPTIGDRIRYTLDASYDITRFELANDTNLLNGELDGILNFTLVFYDVNDNEVYQQSFTGAASRIGTAQAVQQFVLASPALNARSFDLVIDAAHSRAPLQWREVAVVGFTGPSGLATPYPVTPQPITFCTVDSMLFEQTFNDSSNGGWLARVNAQNRENPPFPFSAATNNVDNDNGTSTDATIDAALNGGNGAASPSGGAFVSAFDHTGNSAHWLREGIGNMSAAVGGVIYLEKWNWRRNVPAGGIGNVGQDYMILGANGQRLFYSAPDQTDALEAGQWEIIQARLQPGPGWFLMTDGGGNTNRRIRNGGAIRTATAADFTNVLANVVAIGSQVEGIASFDYPDSSTQDSSGLPNATLAERYALDTVRMASCVSEAQIGVSKSFGTPIENGDGTVDLPYTVNIRNTGNSTLDNLQLVDNIAAQFGSAFLASNAADTSGGVLAGPIVSTANGNPTLPTALTNSYNGTGNLFDGATGSLAPLDEISITFTVRINPRASGAPTQFANTATASADDPTDNRVSDLSNTGLDPTINPGGPGIATIYTPPPPPPDADLVTIKTLTSGDDTPAAGDTVTFQIAVRNDGPADATNVSLTDLLPNGLTATTNNGTTDDGTGNPVGIYDDTSGIWNIGNLANGDSATLTLEGEVDAGEGGNTIENITTAATGDQPDPTTTGDDLTEGFTVVVPSSAFLPPNPVARCRANWYRWTTRRRLLIDSQNALNPRFHEFSFRTTELGANRWYVPQGARNAQQLNLSSRVEPNILNNNAGEAHYGVINYELEPGTNTIIPLNDPGLFEGHAFAAFDSVGRQIARYPTSAQVGSGVQYIASFNFGGGQRGQQNDLRLGASWTSNAFVVPVPDDGQVFVHYIITDEASDGRGAIRYCPEDRSDAPTSYGAVSHEYENDLLLGSRKDVDRAAFTAGGAIGDDNDGVNGSDEDGVASFDPIDDQTDSYSVVSSVTNKGTTDATLYGWIDFDQSNTFEPDEFASIAVPAGTDSGSVTLEWNDTTNIAAGDTFVRLRLTTTPLTNAQAGSVLALDGEVEDHALTITAAPLDADLVTIKTLTSGDDTPAAGDTVTFQIAVRNDGPADATNVSLTDLLPNGLTATTNNGTTDDGTGNPVGIYDDTSGIWNIGNLANGDSATLTLEGEVDAGEGGNTIENITTAAIGDQPDPTDDGNDLTESVTVLSRADLSITKTNTPGENSEVDQTDDTVTSGSTSTYTIRVTNNGPDSITGAVVRDAPGAGLTCNASDPVTLSGDGVPAGTFSIADLTGSGITLGNLDDGQTAIISYSCEVN